MKKLILFLIGICLILGGIGGGGYVGLWLMFIKPIIQCCKAFDTNTLTAMMVGITVIKCVFASAVGGTIAYCGISFGLLCLF